MRTFFSLWFKPRAAIAAHVENPTRFSHALIVIGLAFSSFLQLMLLLWVYRYLPSIQKLFTLKGFQFLFLIFVLFSAIIFTFLKLASLVLYFLARSFGGVATLAQTATAIHWTSLTTLPIGFLFLFFLWNAKAHVRALEAQANTPIFSVILALTAAFGMFLMCIYTFIILTKAIAVTHRINTWRAFATTAVGTIAALLMMILLMIIALKPSGLV